MSAAAEEQGPLYRVYSNQEGAARIGLSIVKASTLARLARKGLVKHTRNGRKVGWTDDQLAGAVAYLEAERAKPRTKAPSSSKTSSAASVPAVRRGDMAPLVSKPGRRYGRPATT